MSAISYRSWDVWTNTTFFAPGQTHRGFYECTIAGTLMAQQTVGFLAEWMELRLGSPAIRYDHPMRSDLLPSVTTTDDGQLCVRVYGELNTNHGLEDCIRNVIALLEAVALAVDGPLVCQRIRFFSNSEGKLLMAARRPIGRGYAFEVEERGTASAKLMADHDFYLEPPDDHHQVGRRHYLTGVQLLGLEDQVPGLIDAAFVQFYQGCEALCRDPAGELAASKKFIARSGATDARELQIIAHHVWRVRNKYFGHGDVQFNLNANLSRDSASAVARQVLVARYLCKRLIDLDCPSAIPLVREMGIYFGSYSGAFDGSVSALETTFAVAYDRREASIYGKSGEKLETYTIAGEV